MNVSAVNGGTGAVAWSTASPMAGGKWDNQYQGAMASVAQLLGTSVSELKSTSVGQSLSSLASAQGVAPDKLLAAIKSGLQQSGTQLRGSRLDNIAQRIANHRHRHHGPGAANPAASTAASSPTVDPNGTNPTSWAAAIDPASGTNAGTLLG
jgi:hypothetical protein